MFASEIRVVRPVASARGTHKRDLKREKKLCLRNVSSRHT